VDSIQFNLLKVTEAAALSSFPWIGKGDKNAADAAATKTMRKLLNEIKMNGTVVIGEGEIDDAPMLYIGETLGFGREPEIDIAVDPIDGTNAIINGKENSMSVIAVAPKGTLLHAPDMYMEKIMVGPKVVGKVNLDDSLINNMHVVAEANGKKINELNVFVQNRSRHTKYIDEARSVGANVFLFEDGDIIYGLATSIEELDVDMCIGIGGAPEGVLAAVALKCLGGEIQAKLLPRNENEYKRCVQMGINNPNMNLTHEQLVKTENCIFVATGITDNIILNGIKKNNGRDVTHSILVDGVEKKIRYIKSESIIHSPN